MSRLINHSNAACHPRSRVSAHLGTTLLLMLFLLVGCKTTPTEKPSNLTLVSRNGTSLYQKAQSRYAKARAMDLQGPELEKEMSAVLADLDAAIVNDPGCPLFYSKTGDVLAELGQYGKAFEYYEQARKLHEDWAPAWIGLAAVSIESGRVENAAGYLDGAKLALGTLTGRVDPDRKEPTLLELLGLNVRVDPGPNPDDPSLDKQAGRQLMLGWLAATEAWTIENPSLVQSAGGRMTLSQASVDRRVRARIEYLRAMIKKSSDEGVQAVAKQLDYALQWDPDFFPAKLELALTYHGNGQHREAERLIRPFMDSGDPKLVNNARLLFVMAQVYAAWFAQQPDVDKAELADGYFSRLHSLNPNHASGYIARAEFYLASGKHFKRPDTLKAGIRCLDEAKRVLGEEGKPAADLRAKLEAAAKT